MKSYHSDSQDNTNPALQCRQQVSEVLKDDEAEADKTIENVYPPYYVKYDIPGIARTLGYSQNTLLQLTFPSPLQHLIMHYT